MLQFLKKYIKGWLLGIILFFIFLSFAFWGVGDIFRRDISYIAKVGKMKIHSDDFLTEYQFRIKALNNDNEISNQNISKDEKIQIVKESINNLTNRYLFLNMAKKLDIKISKEILKKKILNNKLFYKKDGGDEFDKNIYNNIVLQNFGSEERYLNYLENEIIIDMLSSHFLSHSNYPDNLTKKIYNSVNEKRSFDIASVDKIYEQKKIKKPDKNILENFFKQNENLYFFNERRSFTYIHFNNEILSKEIVLDDKEIREIYDERKEEFLIKEKRDVRQIVFNNINDGNKAFQLLEKGEKFSEIGEKITGKNLKVISLGLLEKEQILSEFSEDVFSLEINHYTKPIKTDLGWHILKVTKIIEEQIKPIDLVKDDIRKELILDKSFDVLDAIINEFENELSKGNLLEDIAKKLNLKLDKQELIEKKDFLNKKGLPSIFSNKLFYEDVFGKKVGDDNFIQELEDGFFITRVDKIVQKTQKNFEEAYDDVFEKWSKIEAKEKVIKRVEQFKKKIGQDNFIKTADKLQFDNQITELVNKEALIKRGLSKEFVDKLFNASKDTILELDDEQIYYLVKVKSDKKIVFEKEEYDDFKNNIRNKFGIDNLEQLIYVMKKEFPIKINIKFANSFIKTLE